MITYRFAFAIILFLLFFLFCIWLFLRTRKATAVKTTTVDFTELRSTSEIVPASTGSSSVWVDVTPAKYETTALAVRDVPDDEPTRVLVVDVFDKRDIDRNEQGRLISTGHWYEAYREFMTHEEIVRMFPVAPGLDEKRVKYEKSIR